MLDKIERSRLISFANNACPNRDDHVLPIRCGGVTRCPPFVLRGFVRPLAIAFGVPPQSDERAGEVRLAVWPSTRAWRKLSGVTLAVLSICAAQCSSAQIVIIHGEIFFCLTASLP